MMPVNPPPLASTALAISPIMPTIAAAIDEPDAVLAEDRAEGLGRFDKGRVGARPGAAIDADFADFAHFLRLVHRLHVQPRRKIVKTATEKAARYA